VPEARREARLSRRRKGAEWDAKCPRGRQYCMRFCNPLSVCATPRIDVHSFA
jgi:hypothetical protein